MAERIPITRQGLERIRSELQRLMTVERPDIQKALSEAREHGDLRENAEFHAAKEKQSFIEGRIQELNARMPSFQVVEPSENKTGSIAFGATVTIEDVDTAEVFRYQIVGPDEADMNHKRISFQSPIARALMGNRAGDVVVVTVPRGRMEVEITAVVYE
jgi:transcription elongation factor GreA